jgi:hypothetical protein
VGGLSGLVAREPVPGNGGTLSERDPAPVQSLLAEAEVPLSVTYGIPSAAPQTAPQTAPRGSRAAAFRVKAAARDNYPLNARSDSFSEPMVARTADGS